MVGGDFSNIVGKSIGVVNGQNILQNELFDPNSTTCLSGCVPGTLNALSGATPNYNRPRFLAIAYPSQPWTRLP
jgi:hypothetical protein